MSDSRYSPLGPSTVDIVAKRNALLLPDTHKQEVKNAINSLRSNFERLAVRYADDRFDGPGGTFETWVADTFTQLTCNGDTSTKEVLLEGQSSPWTALGTSSDRLFNLEVNGYYAITISLEVRSVTSADNELLFRLIDSGGTAVVSGSQPVEDLLANVWYNTQTTIYFVPLNFGVATSGDYEIEGRHRGEDLQVGKRSITIHKMMDGLSTGLGPVVPVPPPLPTIPPEFIFTVDTTLAGSSANDEFRLDAVPNDPTFDIDWGDGNFDLNYNGGPITHQYPSTGIFQIKLTGDMDNVEMGTTRDAPKVLSIDNFGISVWASFQNFCKGALNLVSVTSNPPDLSAGPTLAEMWRNCPLLLGSNIDVSQWDISLVTTANGMCSQSTLLDLDISAWAPTVFTGGSTMMSTSAFGTVNYDKMLISWNGKPHVVGVVDFGAGTACYSAGAATTAHDALDGEGWIFSDNGQCP